MSRKVTMHDDSVLCGSCEHCGNGCNASPDSKVFDCEDYVQKLSDILKDDKPTAETLCTDCLMRKNCNLNRCHLTIDKCEYYTPEGKGFVEYERSDDKVNHPSHYTQGGIECIDCIRASMPPEGFQDYCKGNVIKYIFRWRFKGGVEDLRKAQVYLNWLIESAEKKDI